MSVLPTLGLLAIFLAAAGVIWWAGIFLAFTTDAIDTHFGWGEGVGGAVLLALATNLPEIAIIIGCAFTNSMDLAVGNILGGIAIQTVVLVILDGPGLRERIPLMSTVRSLTIVVQGMVVISVLMFCIIGALLPRSLMAFRITPVEIGILLFWLFGLWLTAQNEDRESWKAGHEHMIAAAPGVVRRCTIQRAILLFGLAAVATLICGVAIELASVELAGRFHMSGVIFGATILSAVTALPEVTTGLAAVKVGSFELAISDVIGGNAFLPVLFLLGSLLSGKALLPDAQGPDLYLTALGALLTAVYCAGAVFRSKRMLFGTGIDSLIVLTLYIVGIAGLFFIRS
jgi:cation:H+ antiporter